MNFLILFPKEIISGTHARVSGERSHYLQRSFDLKEGIRIPGGVLNGRRGGVFVEKIQPDEIDLRIELKEDPLPRFPVMVIVAVPRPQTVKKVLSTSSAMGVGEVHFVRSENTEKSYLSSHALLKEEIDQEILLGLEQSGDTIAPEVSVHPKFRVFFEDTLAAKLESPNWSKNPLKLFGHTGQAGQVSKSLSKVDFGQEPVRPVIVAIGPESGWSEFETKLIIGQKFTPITLGPRMLRVETALAVFLGEIELLRGLSQTP